VRSKIVVGDYILREYMKSNQLGCYMLDLFFYFLWVGFVVFVVFILL